VELVSPGKALNSGALVVLMVTTRSAIACAVLALVITSVKIGSLVHMHRAGLPSPVGCAVLLAA
jgi:hypothetical protein